MIVISHLTIHSKSDASLFHFLDTNAVVTNLRLLQVDFKAEVAEGSWAGGVASYSYADSISHVYVSGSLSAGKSGFVGGIVANHNFRSDTAVIYACTTHVILQSGASSYVGGIVGYNLSKIEESLSAVTILGDKGSYVGGIAAYSAGRIFNSQSQGSVEGLDFTYVGGAVGYLSESKSTLEQVLSSADVKTGNNGYAGGLVGNSNGKIQHSQAQGRILGGV